MNAISNLRSVVSATIRLLFAAGLVASTCLAQAQPSPLDINGQRVHPTRILAKHAPGAKGQEKAAIRAAQGLAIHREHRLVPGLVTFDVADRKAAAALATAGPDEQKKQLLQRIAALRRSGLFEYVEPDYEIKIELLPNDEKVQDGSLWGLWNTGLNGGTPGVDIGAEQAWNLTTGSTNVVVAVIDTGISYTHQELATQMDVPLGGSGYELRVKDFVELVDSDDKSTPKDVSKIQPPGGVLLSDLGPKGEYTVEGLNKARERMDAAGDDAGSNAVRLSAVAIPERAGPGDTVTLQCSLTNSGHASISYYSVYGKIYGKIWYEVQEKASSEKNWPAASKEPVLPRFHDGSREPYAKTESLEPNQSVNFTCRTTVRHALIRVVLPVKIRTADKGWETLIVSSSEIVMLRN